MPTSKQHPYTQLCLLYSTLNSTVGPYATSIHLGMGPEARLVTSITLLHRASS